jgi:hypothetical protein
MDTVTDTKRLTISSTNKHEFLVTSSRIVNFDLTDT